MMTEFDSLKQSWQADQAVPAELFDRIGLSVKDSSELLESKIARRDLTEAVSSALVGAIFLGMSFYTKTWIDWTGCMVVLVTSFWIPWRMWQARKRPRLELSASTFCDCLDSEVELIERQIELLKNVGWWYLLPLYSGISLLLIGLLGPPFATFNLITVTIAMGLCFALYFWIWLANQKAWKNRLVPLLDYYVQTRTAIDQNDETLMPSLDAPTQFLVSKRRQPVAARQWRIGLIITIIATISTAIGGLYLHMVFDERTGLFIVSSTPVVTILSIAMTGIWRRAYGVESVEEI